MFNFQRRLAAPAAAPVAAPVAPAAFPAVWAAPALTSPTADGPGPGCGWFDSSHELRAGLRVDEELPPDAVARLVPPSWWLAWELDATMSSVRARCT